MKKRVVIPALNLCRPMTGVGRYISQLSYIKIHELTLIAHAPNSLVIIKNNFNRINCANHYSKIAKLFWVLTNLKTTQETDVIHYPQPLVPIRKPKCAKCIVTIHDILFLEYPRYYNFIEILFLRLSTLLALRQADTIICVSEYTRSTLLKHYKFIEKDATYVIYNPIIKIKRSKRLKSLQKDFGKFLLIVSNNHPRKNITNTIDAFKRSSFAKNGFKLILCGHDDSKQTIEYSEKIIRIGYQDEESLMELYKSAYALLFFSSGEGFGYPILEAALHSTPTYASNNTSISELFNYKYELLCNEYDNSNGILDFLNKVYDNKEINLKILDELNKTLEKCDFKIFSKKMKEIYK